MGDHSRATLILAHQSCDSGYVFGVEQKTSEILLGLILDAHSDVKISEVCVHK